MDAARLEQLVLGFRTCRIAVLGDFFLDKYLDVDPALAEVSLETGRTAHQVVSVRCSPGAAGTVVNNLAALGAGQVHALGFAGDDGEGHDLRRGLEALRCDTSALFTVPGRFTPTYLKPRDAGHRELSGEHERYDTKNRVALPAAVQERIVERLSQLLPGVDAVIVLDQVEEAECGMVTENVRTGLATLAREWPAKVFWADSRRRIGLFRHMIVKVNAHEAVREVFGHSADAADEAIVQRAAGELARRAGSAVFVTAGARGIWVGDSAPALVPAVRVEGPTDPTGAGDSATAGAVLSLCAGATLQEAALVANLVASITIQQLGTTGTANPDRLRARLAAWHSQR